MTYDPPNYGSLLKEVPCKDVGGVAAAGVTAGAAAGTADGTVAAAVFRLALGLMASSPVCVVCAIRFHRLPAAP